MVILIKNKPKTLIRNFMYIIIGVAVLGGCLLNIVDIMQNITATELNTAQRESTEVDIMTEAYKSSTKGGTQ